MTDAVQLVYRITWTEYERGWGSRPDGATLHRDMDAASEFVNHIVGDRGPNSVVPDEYISPDLFPGRDDIPQVVATPEQWAAIHASDNGTIWSN